LQKPNAILYPAEVPRDVTKLIDRFYIGSEPVYHTDDFDVVVLCAEEIQPPASMFQGLVLRIPLEDTQKPFPPEAISAIRKISHDLAFFWKKGANILVTCQMGRNRSALVCAAALSRILQVPTDQTAPFVRKTRRDTMGYRALSNRYFWDLLHTTKLSAR
jgi:protein-tyrosine phosphatase